MTTEKGHYEYSATMTSGELRLDYVQDNGNWQTVEEGRKISRSQAREKLDDLAERGYAVSYAIARSGGKTL